MNPYNHLAESYESIYRLHKYWSKKPPNIVRTLISKHTKKGQIVLDPFSGSGVSIIEGITLGRRAVGIDINPSAIFITQQLMAKVDLQILQNEFERIVDNVKGQINSMYILKRRNKEFIGSHFIWNNGKISEAWYRNSNHKLTKLKATRSDLEKSKSYSYDSIGYITNRYKFLENSKINLKEGDRVSNLFSPRNLHALTFIYSQIELIEDTKVMNLMKFCFTSAMGQSSVMVFVNKRTIDKRNGKKIPKTTKSVGSWVIGYWKPKEHFEINVWDCFARKFIEILKAKRAQLEVFTFCDESLNFQQLNSIKNGYLLSNQPAQKYLSTLPDNSIDYVISDPPHGDRIPYLELSQLWNCWLGNEVNFDEEIIISTSKERNKTSENYRILLTSVFKEIYRVLKSNKKFTIMFNSLDDVTWITIIKTLNSIGFYLEKIETLNYSATSVVQNNRDTGLKTDFVLTYKKSNHTIKEITLLNGEIGKKTLKNMICEMIREKPLENFEILNILFFQLLKKNQFFRLSQAIEIINNLKNNRK